MLIDLFFWYLNDVFVLKGKKCVSSNSMLVITLLRNWVIILTVIDDDVLHVQLTFAWKEDKSNMTLSFLIEDAVNKPQ